MKKNKKIKNNLRLLIGIGLSNIFIILLFLSLRWADYQKIFIINEPIVSGHKILDEKAYKSIVDQLDYEIINTADIVEIRKVLEKNPFVKAARVSKHFPNKLSVQIVEREPLGIINIDNQLMIDEDAVVLPGKNYSENYLIPVLSGFNSAKELYPEGEKTFSIKIKEAVGILRELSNNYRDLYENISEITLNKDDEYVLILADRPTRVIIGKENINLKFNILKSFDKALGQRQLTDFRLIDMRYNKQLVAREWA